MHIFFSVKKWKFVSMRNLMKTYNLFQVKSLYALSSKQTNERNRHNFLPLFIYLTKLLCKEEAEKLSCEMTSMRILSLWQERNFECWESRREKILLHFVGYIKLIRRIFERKLERGISAIHNTLPCLKFRELQENEFLRKYIGIKRDEKIISLVLECHPLIKLMALLY